MIKSFQSKSGYTLVEALIYIAVFVVMSLVIIVLILAVLETSRRVTPMNSLSRMAVSSFEVITREIRRATSIDTANSSLATSTGSLQLNTLDAGGNARIAKFYLNSGLIKIDENGTYLGPLSTSDVSVNALIFNLATSTKKNLIKMELNLSAGSGKYQKTEKFYSSVQLRADN